MFKMVATLNLFLSQTVFTPLEHLARVRQGFLMDVLCDSVKLSREFPQSWGFEANGSWHSWDARGMLLSCRIFSNRSNRDQNALRVSGDYLATVSDHPSSSCTTPSGAPAEDSTHGLILRMNLFLGCWWVWINYPIQRSIYFELFWYVFLWFDCKRKDGVNGICGILEATPLIPALELRLKHDFGAELSENRKALGKARQSRVQMVPFSFPLSTGASLSPYSWQPLSPIFRFTTGNILRPLSCSFGEAKEVTAPLRENWRDAAWQSLWNHGLGVGQWPAKPGTAQVRCSEFGCFTRPKRK